MKGSYVVAAEVKDYIPWEKIKGRKPPLSFDLEVTARCNNNCRHCYINLPAEKESAKTKELSLGEIDEIADEAVSLGALWCLLTGGEPLLREDFEDIYVCLKKKGLLVSVFTNATRITQAHIGLFQKYPPRDLEVSVYGVRQQTYERVTRTPGSFDAFCRGMELLEKSGVKVRLKAMALRSNVGEFSEIAAFCRQRTKDYFRFDPFLHLRFDRDPQKNKDIRSERLSPEEIACLEQSDPERALVIKDVCQERVAFNVDPAMGHPLFLCGVGEGSFTLGYDGRFRLCSSLWHSDCIYDSKKGSLTHAWHSFAPGVRNMRSNKRDFVDQCGVCPLINLCMWCPAHADLETGVMDEPVDYFCKVAHCRRAAIK